MAPVDSLYLLDTWVLKLSVCLDAQHHKAGDNDTSALAFASQHVTCTLMEICHQVNVNRKSL